MKRVAVIGGGVGGLSFVYYLNQLLYQSKMNHNIEITLFEKASQLGGRVQFAEFKKDQINVEMGGAVFQTNGSNPNICQLIENVKQTAKELKKESMIAKVVELYNPYEKLPSGSAIWNGKQFIYQSPHYYFTTVLFMAKKWLPTVLFQLFQLVLHFIISILNIFQIVFYFGFFTLVGLFRVTTQHKHLFQTFFSKYHVKDYVQSINQIFPDFYLLQNAKEFLITRFHISEVFLKTIFEPGVRSIYSQNLDNYNTIAALVNIQASNSDKLRTFVNGNRKFFETAVQLIASQTQLIHLHCHQAITSIEKNQLNYICKLEDGSCRSFDVVVMAVPVEKSNIEFINLNSVKQYIQTSSREFIKTYLMAVKGKVNPAYFGVKHSYQVPNLITTTKLSEEFECPFLSFQTLWQSKQDGNYTVTKILSKQPISQEILKDMFLEVVETQEFEFPYAYPKLRPLNKEELIAPTCLDAHGLFYLNSIETIASAMEASVYSAKNVAHLVKEQLV